ETVETRGRPTTLETLRAEEMAKLSEKDSLSAKISEMLNASSGKISVSAKASATQGSGNLLSGQNAVVTQNSISQATNTATAIETVTQATQQAETPLNIGSQPAQAPLQAVAEQSVSSTASAPGASVQGVDATSSNSNSQAAASNKAATQNGAPAEQVSKQITAAVKEGVDRIKVQLNPAELGRVDIKMEIAGDGKVMAVIAAENQDTLDLLQQDSKLLEKALQDAGFDADGDSLNFSLSQGEQDAENMQTASGDTDPLSEQGSSEEEDANLAPLYSTNHSSSGGLDIAV
ncbi:MAG: flagellar hook-length control protein FliK, partial [Sneathiellales bacterium]|nr:flagellar hook-length control protein FliK [Sneathiellales bacterium]